MLNIRTTAILAVAFVLMGYACTCAENLPDGYDGAKWGASVDDVQQHISFFPMSACDTPDGKFKTIYVVAPDGEKIKNITYYLFNNKLFQVEIEMCCTGDAVLDELKNKYGKPVAERILSKDSAGKCMSTVWRDDKTEVICRQILPNKEVIWKNKVLYSSLPIRAAAEKGDSGRIIQYKTKIISK